VASDRRWSVSKFGHDMSVIEGYGQLRLGKALAVILIGIIAASYAISMPRGGAISPPQSRIVFATNDLSGVNYVNIMNINGTGVTVLANCGTGECYPSPSPDGTKILYQLQDSNGSAIILANIDGSSPVRLSPIPGYDTRPNWRPDGNLIIFSMVTNPGFTPTTAAIMTMNTNGSNRQTLLADGGTYNVEARYNPAATKVTYMSGKSGTQQVWTMNADGSASTQCTSVGISGDPVYSSDGTKLAFGSNPGTGNVNMYTANAADCSSPTQLTTFINPFEGGDASWYGTKLAFEWDDGGNGQSVPNVPAFVWIVNSNGTGATSTGQPCASVGCHPTWIPPAP
jgi:Tol biopolymer transport system component